MYLKEIIQKTKNGTQRKYAQFVESIRTEKGPRQKTLVNLGRIDNKSGSKMLELLAIFKETIRKFSTKHAECNVTFVGDRGLINGKNIDLLIASGYRYILGFKMRSIPKSERCDLFRHKKWKPITKDLEHIDLNYKGQRLVIYFNKERAVKDRLKREETITRIQDKIKNGTILSIVSSSDYKKFLKIKGEKPYLDQEK